MEILSFDEFRKSILILEQDELGAGAPPPPPSPAVDTPPPPPADFGAGSSTLPPDPNAPAPAPTEPTGLRFVFIQDAPQKKWHGEFDKDGGVKRFTVYEVSQEELEKWLTTHKDEENAELVKAALNGKRPMPSNVYSDFKREVMDGTLGTDKGPIDITFDSETDFDNPSTDDLNVVFLRSSKK
jgi:hypothetical protein